MKTKTFTCRVLLIIGISLTITSCNDLDLNPISSYNAGSFYKTQKDFELAIIGVYDKFQSLYNDLIPAVLEGRSDNLKAYQAGHQNDGYALCSMFIDDAETPSLRSIWQIYWNLIDRCNVIIDKIDAGSFTDESKRSSLKGEAYFFRGLAYFELGWMFGGVPLIDHQMTIAEIRQTPRSSQDETFSFAATDLSAAIKLLPGTWSSAELGKTTKYAAQGILARLYMFRNKFSDAKPLLQSIIESGKYQMATSYADCFLDQYDNSPEHVFQVQFTSGNVGEGNKFVLYEVHESIRSSMFPIGGTLGPIVSDDLYESFEAGDLRRDFSILDQWSDATGTTHTEKFFIKYAHGSIPGIKGDYEVNMPILRFTDVKLMYAEILNTENYNPNGEAFSILNAVRNRAGLGVFTAAEIGTKEAFGDALMHERRVEFACEYLRWFDLIRTGKAKQVMDSFLARTDEGNGTYQMQEYRTLFAIPQYELTYNPDRNIIWQNPGY